MKKIGIVLGYLFMPLLAFTWEILQNVAALIVAAILFFKIKRIEVFRFAVVISIKNVNWGVSLGRFIIIGESHTSTNIAHEYGHSIQSLILGPLYLFVVGIPSICRAARFMKYRKDKKGRLYFEAYPENWADKLGKVSRSR